MLITSASIIINISTLFGLTHIQIVIENGDPVAVINKKLRIVTLVCFIIYILLLVEPINAFNNHEFSGFQTLEAVSIAIMLTDNCFHYIFLPLISPPTRTALEMLSEIDKALRKSTTKAARRKRWSMQVFLVYLCPVSFLIIDGLKSWKTLEGGRSRLVLRALLDAYANVVMDIMLNQQFLFMLVIKEKLNTINRRLGNMAQKMKKEVYQDELSYLQHIKLLMQLHDKTCAVTRIVNRCYGFLMFASGALQFYHIVIFSFFSYVQISSKQYVTGFCDFYNVVLKTYQLLRTIFWGHFTYNMEKNSVKVLHKVIHYARGEAVKRELMMFSRQLLHSSALFTAAGVYKLNATMAYLVGETTISNGSALLLVMFQFHFGDPPIMCISNSTVNALNATI